FMFRSLTGSYRLVTAIPDIWQTREQSNGRSLWPARGRGWWSWRSQLYQREVARGCQTCGAAPIVARALSEARSAAVDYGLPQEVSGFASARRAGGGELRAGAGAVGPGLRGNGGERGRAKDVDRPQKKGS